MTIFKHIMIIILTIILVTFNMPMAVVHAENVGYSVRAILPENQIDRNQTYFDLFMKPKQKQVIHVEINNRSKEDMEIYVQITNPITNRNGLIDYTNIDTVVDDSLKTPITEVAFIEENTVKVPAKKSKIVPIQLEMPETEYDGIILGGIYFEKSTGEEEPTEGGISNKYTYVIGLKLAETDKEVEPNLHLKSVKPGLVNYRTAIIANIQNSAPAIVDNLILKGKVYNANGEEINRVKVKDYRIAPNSNMDFVMDWGDRKIDPGKYTMMIDANTDQQSWSWEEEFVIPAKEAKGINKEAVNIDYTWNIVIALSVVILVLMFIIFRLIRKNKR